MGNDIPNNSLVFGAGNVNQRRAQKVEGHNVDVFYLLQVQ